MRLCGLTRSVATITGGIGGTSTVVKEVYLLGIVSPNVAAVKIQRADGSATDATLTKWPHGGFASFAHGSLGFGVP